MRRLLGDNYEAFERALEGAPTVSLRVNPRKATDVQDLPVGDRVPWCETGRYLTERPAFTFDPLLHAGAYYVQEAASMFLERAVGRYVTEPVVALDLCAAPGGKSTHLISTLPEGSLLVSNETIRSRSRVLAENMAKWGAPSVVVTQADAKDFGRLTHRFDLIVADMPCSGEGRREVDSRTLAIFSALSYEDGTEAMRRSGFYKEIVGSPPEEKGETYYFLDGASVKPGGSDDYVRDWVVAEYENIDVPPLIGARFSATVYVHGDDVVLAYRGTSEDPEWLNDLLGGLSNFTLEEPYAKLMALRAARMYAAPRRNVYITGHSLGGYLAQVGAAELIRSGCADKLRRCEYFNGMGLDYGRMSPSLPDQYQHASERELLSGWGENRGACPAPHLWRPRLAVGHPFG